MLYIAVYQRKTETNNQKSDDSNSIQNQKSMLLQYALEQGWEVYNIYSDDDYTGADRRRPAFNQLLEDAEKRKISILFFVKHNPDLLENWN